MTVRGHLTTLLCASLCFAGVPLTAAAAEPPSPPTNPSDEDLGRARQLFDNGKRLYLEGSYDPAIAAFNQAYALSGDPLLLYNIAQAYDRADRFDEAIEYFEYYRAFAPPDESEALGEKVDSLRRRKLKAAADAAEDDTEPTPTAPPPDATTPEPSDPAPTPVDDEPDKPRVFGPAAIALTIVSVAGLATGAGLGVTSRRRSDDADGKCNDSPVLCPPEAESDLDASRNLGIGADVSFAIGAAAGVAAIVIIAVNASKRRKSSGTAGDASARVSLSPRRGGAGLRVRF